MSLCFTTYKSNREKTLQRILVGILTVVLFIGVITGYAADQYLEIKGKIIKIELEPSDDPQNPNLWPCLLIAGREAMLVGAPDILVELDALEGKEVVLAAKKLPDQKYGDKEYQSFEVSEIEELYDQDYLSIRKVIKEFRDAMVRKGIIDESGKYKEEGALKSIWYDKNENGKIDKNDKLFLTGISTGSVEGKNLLYPLRVISRRYRHNKVYYQTFIMPDPAPQTFDPAIMGQVQYDSKTESYSINVCKIYRKPDNTLVAPSEEDKSIVLGKRKDLKFLVGKTVLLSGDNYEIILWVGNKEVELDRADGQYVIKLKGKVFIVNDDQYSPWELSLVFMKDSEGQKYELRKIGYVNFWVNFLRKKEIVLTGALRPAFYYKGNYYPTIEVTWIR